MNIQQRTKEVIRSLNLMSDIMMNFVFNDDPEAVQELLNPIFERDDIQVISCKSQSLIQNTYGKDARLDILAKDNQGKLYDIEMQQEDRYAPPERARYYSSMLDNRYISKNWEIKDKKNPWYSMPETYVIFFTRKDHFHANLPAYYIDRFIRNLNYRPFSDREHIIYVNCSFKDDNSPIGQLIHDLVQTDYTEITNKVLKNRVKYFIEGEGEKICAKLFRN